MTCLHIDAYNVGMKRRAQFTIRGVPRAVEETLRRRARTEGKSLNRVLLEALTASTEPIEHHDLDWIAGTWVEDPEFDQAVAAQDRIDEEMWR